ncbi:MAG: hypothetical protein LBP52_03660 [Burkholderiaceae bacterium]|nr:hypothetical protein [Burkholderiaceae bacterium]
MNTIISLITLALALTLALAMKPWRLLRHAGLISPLLASVVITPWLWAMPWLHHMPLQLQLSGACLIALVLGWPLAVPVLCVVALIAGQLAALPWAAQAEMALWMGVLPATLSTLLGIALRRCVRPHLFVYILGRAFLGTVLCIFASGVLAQWLGGQQQLQSVDGNLALVGRWLLAWGDGFMTGMVAAVCVAFKPQWLATWSDRLYLRPGN